MQDRNNTLQYLRRFTQQLTEDIGIGQRDGHGRLILPDAKMYGEYTKLLARCHVELGEWQTVLREGSIAVSQLFMSELTPGRSNRDPCRLLRGDPARPGLVPSVAYLGTGKL